MDSIRIKRNIDNIHLRSMDMWKTLHKRDFDGAYRSIVELLTWIVNSDIWFKQNYPEYEIVLKEIKCDRLFLLGLHQAYNSFKHNMNIISLEEKNYDMYLDLNNHHVTIERIVWLQSTELEDENNSKVAFKGYCKFIEGESVTDIFERAQKILNKVYKSFCEKEAEQSFS